MKIEYLHVYIYRDIWHRIASQRQPSTRTYTYTYTHNQPLIITTSRSEKKKRKEARSSKRVYRIAGNHQY